jgi:hypothetical protein
VRDIYPILAFLVLAGMIGYQYLRFSQLGNPARRDVNGNDIRTYVALTLLWPWPLFALSTLAYAKQTKNEQLAEKAQRYVDRLLPIRRRILPPPRWPLPESSGTDWSHTPQPTAGGAALVPTSWTAPPNPNWAPPTPPTSNWPTPVSTTSTPATRKPGTQP